MKSNGFTCLELSVVVVALALIASVAVMGENMWHSHDTKTAVIAKS